MLASPYRAFRVFRSSQKSCTNPHRSLRSTPSLVSRWRSAFICAHLRNLRFRSHARSSRTPRSATGSPAIRGQLGVTSRQKGGMIQEVVWTQGAAEDYLRCDSHLASPGGSRRLIGTIDDLSGVGTQAAEGHEERFPPRSSPGLDVDHDSQFPKTPTSAFTLSRQRR